MATNQRSGTETSYIAPPSPHLRSQLSFAQQRLWFLDQYEHGNPVYITSLAVSLKGPLHRAALEQSLNELVTRHEALRTTFPLRDNQPTQMIAPSWPFPLAFINLSELAQADRESEALRLASLAAQQPFDLTTGPLFRASLWRISEQDHLLLLNAHQIVADEWSMCLLIGELVACYDAFAQGYPSPFPELPMQYGDFAHQQQMQMQGQNLERLLAYWKQQLAGAPPLLVLPTDHPRPARQSYRGARQRFILSESLTGKLQALSEREGVTPFMTLLAGFNVLLHRYTEQADINVGTLIDKPQRRQLLHVVGPVTNTLVLRTKFQEDVTFRALLRQVREVTLGASAHQEMPFEKLVEELNPARDLSHSPLFQVMFVFKPSPLAPQHLSGLNVSALELNTRTTAFDLTFEMVEEPDRYSGIVDYATDLFEAPTINRMIGHFQMLLQGIVADPDQHIWSLPLLTEPERKQLLVDWNNTRTDDSLDRFIPQLFEDQVKRTPDDVAVLCDGVQLTYQELNERSSRVARLLVKEGVGPDVLVALLAERGIELQTAILAIFKAGGAFLPLDPLHPAKRLSQVLSQSKSPLIIATGEFAPVLSQALAEMPSTDCPRILQMEHLLKQQPPDEALPLPSIQGSTLAYVMFTSGSTGMPKGVMVNHLGMLNHNYAKMADLQITAADRVAQNGPQCFDIFVWQSLSALLVGGRVHIFKDTIAHDPRRLLEEVELNKISVLQLVPSMLRAIIQEVESLGEARPLLSALRWVVPTGDALPTDLCRKWLKLYPGIPLLNTYGSTECSDDQCHIAICEPPPAEYELPIASIGRPIRNMRVYVLDRMREPVPIGVAGELYIGGIGVGPGYLHNSKQTTEVFLPDPFVQEPGARLYKTGDMARYLPDGSLEFLGRTDHMVKIRGFRIEPGDIEVALAEHQAVEEVVVLAKAVSSGDKRLVAYVVPKPLFRAPRGSTGLPRKDNSSAKLIAQLRTFLQERLPDYMVPSAFALLQAMPLNANGKVDRKSLPEPELTNKELESAFVPPRTPVEEIIAQQWKQILGVERVGVLDNFFALQGHSLLAVQALSRLHETFRIDLPVHVLFEAPTVAGLAVKVEQKLYELVESLSDEEARNLIGDP
ncbi:MAG TPA: amino acid adenylation domain-containing protein [Ktedonobacteraceae bacterium]|nr:amino acid adenylation domain-containing protein [Ktedonobacteraceae bacterium]